MDGDKTVDWDEIEENMMTQWYQMSKIMGTIIGKDFPAKTFEEIYRQVLKDPSFKTTETTEDTDE